MKFKYELGQTVYFMEDNKIHSSEITARFFELAEYRHREANSKIRYMFSSAVYRRHKSFSGFEESELFPTLKDLINDLALNIKTI